VPYFGACADLNVVIDVAAFVDEVIFVFLVTVHLGELPPHPDPLPSGERGYF
jgi:hypothetical protein